MPHSQSNLKLQLQNEFLSTIEVGVVSLDANFVIDSWNLFMENHSGIPASRIMGDNLFEHFPDIDEQWLRAKTEPVFSLASPIFVIWEQRPHVFKFDSARPITSASETMYQNVTVFPLLGVNGKVERMCMIVYDVTDQALAKIRAENLNAELEKISRIDGLTGLYNRRYWQERFDNMFKLAQRREKSVSVIMLDIDHFKKVNDTYGHQAGDEVIRSLAEVIQASTRETDIAGRYGGEEFVIVLCDTDGQNAKLAAERMRKKVEEQTVEHDGVSISYTISVGISQYESSHASAMAWLELSDQALYRAKETGRNRVIIDNDII